MSIYVWAAFLELINISLEGVCKYELVESIFDESGRVFIIKMHASYKTQTPSIQLIKNKEGEWYVINITENPIANGALEFDLIDENIFLIFHEGCCRPFLFILNLQAEVEINSVDQLIAEVINPTKCMYRTASI